MDRMMANPNFPKVSRDAFPTNNSGDFTYEGAAILKPENEKYLLAYVEAHGEQLEREAVAEGRIDDVREQLSLDMLYLKNSDFADFAVFEDAAGGYAGDLIKLSEGIDVSVQEVWDSDCEHMLTDEYAFQSWRENGGDIDFGKFSNDQIREWLG